MADNTAETALKYLRDPSVVVGIGAVAASLLYMASRPSPIRCPVDVTQQSIEIPVSRYYFFCICASAVTIISMVILLCIFLSLFSQRGRDIERDFNACGLWIQAKISIWSGVYC